VTKFYRFIDDVTLFGLQALARFFRPPLELHQIWTQIGEAGSRSFPLVAASGFALGVVMTLHSHDSDRRYRRRHVSLKELPPPGLHKDKWDGVCMVILK
jgi:ABC-type transporter Mla maintaining outer membrane lipid asymmetry permease subunit MlaE